MRRAVYDAHVSTIVDCGECMACAAQQLQHAYLMLKANTFMTAHCLVGLPIAQHFIVACG